MIEIYGKDNCSFCDTAIRLCTDKSLDFVYKKLGADYTRDELFDLIEERAPGTIPRTFPQVFMNEEYVGGFT